MRQIQIVRSRCRNLAADERVVEREILDLPALDDARLGLSGLSAKLFYPERDFPFLRAVKRLHAIQIAGTWLARPWAMLARATREDGLFPVAEKVKRQPSLTVRVVVLLFLEQFFSLLTGEGFGVGFFLSLVFPFT